MWKKVYDYILQYELLRPGDRVIAAISGGADSVCLLSVLEQILQKHPECRWELKTVHVHHGLRAGEADRDAAFVKALCARLKLPYTVIYKDVAGYAKQQGYSLEEAGRILRYQVLEDEARAWNADKIALAHHQDDNAETILHHLLRGSGFKGLGGMRPQYQNRIRPLMCTDRTGIIHYLSSRKLDWVEDSSNSLNDYTRNRIRNQIMPLLITGVNEKAADNILRAGNLFAQADDYFEGIAGRIWEEAGTETGPADLRTEAAILLTAVTPQHPLVRSYLYGQMIAAVLPYRKNITARHYAAMEALLTQPAGSRLSLPGSITVIRDYRMLRVTRNMINENIGARQEAVIRMDTFPWKKDTKIIENQYTKWFDYDKINGALSVRTRQSGDYFILKDGGRKTVKRYMIDEKIPKEQRDQIFLLADGNHILWIIGYRISEYYKITEHTKNVLQATCDGGEQNDR